jgi:hypothetical protein
MEMHFFDGNGMDGGFGFAEELKRSDGAGFHRLREWGSADDGENGREMAMRGVGRCRLRLVRVSFVPMRVFAMGVRLVCVLGLSVGVGGLMRGLAGGEDIHFGCGDASAHDFAHFKARADIQCRCGLFQMGKGNAGVNQCAQKHVPAYAGKTFQISNTHRL